ncbi:MAG: hypothetical protein WA770_02215, partial [Pseudolabrys sp.]
ENQRRVLCGHGPRHRKEQRLFRRFVEQEETMTNHFEDAGSPAWEEHTQRNKNMREVANETFSKASETARDAGEKAKRVAAEAASTMSEHVMGLLNDQLGVGAHSAINFAGSMRVAADELEQENPMLAGLVRGFAQNVDQYADQLEDKTVEQLLQSASAFTRRQPALTFGLAALAGFFAFRMFKNANAGSVSSPSIQPTHSHPQGN